MHLYIPRALNAKVYKTHRRIEYAQCTRTCKVGATIVNQKKNFCSYFLEHDILETQRAERKREQIRIFFLNDIRIRRLFDWRI